MWVAACLVIFPFMMVGCDEDELDSPRLFKPKSLTVESYYDGLIATWVGTEGAKGYRLEIASDEAFTTPEKVVDTDGKTRTATLTGLKENQLYYLRLCATTGDESLNSKYIYAEITTGIAYSIFLPVEADNLTFRTARLEWRESVKADRIKIEHTSGTSEVREQMINEEDITSQSVLIIGLSEGQSYKVTLYDGENPLGVMRFTIPVKPEGTITIDASNASSLQTLIDNAPEGGTMMFTGEATYDYSQEYIYIKKNITLVGEPGVARPTLYVKGILLAGDTPSTAIENITLQRIDFSGMAWTGQEENITDEPATQLIGVDLKNTSELSVANLKVSDCMIRNFASSFIELISGVTSSSKKVRIQALEIDNIQAYDLGRNKTGYASFLSITNKKECNAYCRKYTIRNSTFHHLMRGFIEARVFDIIDNYTNPTIVIENCTFDSYGNSLPVIEESWLGTNAEMTKPFFDFKASGITATIKPEITRCVFGEMFAVRLSNKFVQGASLVVDNSYMLTVSKDKYSGDSTVKPLLDLGGTADGLFPDRNGYNYRISSDAGINNVGDPEWY